MKSKCLFSLKILFFCSGWLLAIALVAAVWPRLSHRLFLQFPSYQKAEWDRALAGKKQQFALPWQDKRPLTILVGDSQVELGDWYGLFGGSIAARNCGLSRAKIADVSELVSAMVDREPKNVVLMCGVNNLGNQDSFASCTANYEQLILNVQSTLKPGKIIVLSVMPVRESAVDRRSHELNGRISKFNNELASICARKQAEFVDVTKAVAAAGGGLSPELTFDGWHLNAEGYRKLADALAANLSGSN